MLAKPSLFTRIGVGKAVGFSLGLAGFVGLSVFAADTGAAFRWAVLLWYTTLGAIIGVFGVVTYHPVFKLPFPWWVRAPLIGAWMNFVLVLFAYQPLSMAMQALFGVDGALRSPYWFVFEGALAGLAIGFAATRLGGEGAATMTGTVEKTAR